MSRKAHDAAFAAVSHLPHMLAFAMMNSITQQVRSDELLSLAGPAFATSRALPRVIRRCGAAPMLRANRDEVLAQSRQFEEALQQLEQAMMNNDDQALEDLITLASHTRANWRMGAQRKRKDDL